MNDEQRQMKAVYDWQYKRGGSFHAALFKLLVCADAPNLELLRSAYPIDVEGFYRYGHELEFWEKCKHYMEVS
jgi:hypothetical protein